MWWSVHRCIRTQISESDDPKSNGAERNFQMLRPSDTEYQEYLKLYHEYGQMYKSNRNALKSFLIPFSDEDGPVDAVRIEADTFDDALSALNDKSPHITVDGKLDERSAKWFDSNGYTYPIMTEDDITPDTVRDAVKGGDIGLHVHIYTDQLNDVPVELNMEIKNCGKDMGNVLLECAYERPHTDLYSAGLIPGEYEWFMKYGSDFEKLEYRDISDLTDEISRLTLSLDPYDSEMYRIAEKIVEARLISHVVGMSDDELCNAIYIARLRVDNKKT